MFTGYSLTFFIVNEESSFNDYGEEVFETEEVIVDNCLVSPFRTDDNKFPDVFNDDVKLRIDIPKTFDRDLSNSKVLINSKIYTTIGDSGSYMVENTPGDWNRFIVVSEKGVAPDEN